VKTQSAKATGSRAPVRRAAPPEARKKKADRGTPRENGTAPRSRSSPPSGALQGPVFIGPDGEPADLDRYPVLDTKLGLVDDFLLDPRNARSHPEESIKTISSLLTRYGQRKPIVVHESGVVKAGNGTLQAAKCLGWKFIAWAPAPEKPEDATGFALGDNRSAELSRWNEEVLGEELRGLVEFPDYSIDSLAELGFDYSKVESYIRGPDSGVEEDVPKLPANPRTRVGDFIQLGEHRLVCGDSREASTWGRLLGKEKARMIWTDPPFGVEIVGGNHALSRKERIARGGKIIANDELDPEDLQEFLRSVFALADSFTAPGGAWYVKAPSGDLFYEFARVLGRKGLGIWRHTLVWVKNSLVMGRVDYHYRHESIFYGWKKGSHYFTADRTQDSVFEIDRPSRSEEHPTMTPIDLIARHVLNSTKRGWLVVDPFAGSGSTLIACERENRIAACIELDPGYCDVIVERWEKLTGKKAKRQKDAA
jgi:site-specific DNA-methyltransferase (adenine-specific)